MTVRQAQLQVMADIQPLQKEFVRQLGYSAMMYEHLVSHLKPLLVRNNLIFNMTHADIIDDKTVKSSTNRDMRHVTLSCTFELHLSSGDEDGPVRITTLGEAIDHSDKACGKATTYAAKYALRQLFMLEYGDDEPDRDAPQQGVSVHRKERALVAIRTAQDNETLDKLWRQILDPSTATFTKDQETELLTALHERRSELEAAAPTSDGD